MAGRCRAATNRRETRSRRGTRSSRDHWTIVVVRLKPDTTEKGVGRYRPLLPLPPVPLVVSGLSGPSHKYGDAPSAEAAGWQGATTGHLAGLSRGLQPPRQPLPRPAIHDPIGRDFSEPRVREGSFLVAQLDGRMRVAVELTDAPRAKRP